LSRNTTDNNMASADTQTDAITTISSQTKTKLVPYSKAEEGLEIVDKSDEDVLQAVQFLFPLRDFNCRLVDMIHVSAAADSISSTSETKNSICSLL
jgi:hypothetical protein